MIIRLQLQRTAVWHWVCSPVQLDHLGAALPTAGLQSLQQGLLCG